MNGTTPHQNRADALKFITVPGRRHELRPEVAEFVREVLEYRPVAVAEETRIWLPLLDALGGTLLKEHISGSVLDTLYAASVYAVRPEALVQTGHDSPVVRAFVELADQTRQAMEKEEAGEDAWRQARERLGVTETPEQKKERLRAQRMAALGKAKKVREEAAQANIMGKVGLTASREGLKSRQPQVSHEEPQLVSGMGMVVTDLGKIASIRRYIRDMRSVDWAADSPVHRMILGILGRKESGQTVTTSDKWIRDEDRETLRNVLDRFPRLFALTTEGEILVVRPESAEDAEGYQCVGSDGCGLFHRRKQWRGVPDEVWGVGCVAEIGEDPYKTSEGRAAVYAMYQALAAEQDAQLGDLDFDELRDRVKTGDAVARWNSREHGKYGYLSTGKFRRILRKMRDQGEIVRTRAHRHILVGTEIRTLPAVYETFEQVVQRYPDLVAENPVTRLLAENQITRDDDAAWGGYWARRWNRNAERVAVAA